MARLTKIHRQQASPSVGLLGLCPLRDEVGEDLGLDGLSWTRLENRTGKSRHGRHRRPSKPTVNRLIRKTGKTEKHRENQREQERNRFGVLPDRIVGSCFRPGKFPREIPYSWATTLQFSPRILSRSSPTTRTPSPRTRPRA
jgi:hypothetical protein